MSKGKRTGVCKLLGAPGVFVKSHIIPQAFARRAHPELPYMSLNEDERPKRRWSGWYDENLVTAEGERLLARLDDSASRLFFANGLTFRSKQQRRFDPYRLVEIDVNSTEEIRLFGLSLLWRAAVTSLEPFSGIELDSEDITSLSERITARSPGSYLDFPMLLFVFSDQPEAAPMAPFVLNELHGIKFVRFFLDGVILYVSKTMSAPSGHGFGRWLVGAESDKLRLFALPYEGSSQQATAESAASLTLSKWGDPWAASGEK